MRDWLTVRFDRLVLVVARTVTALNRLLDVLSLLHLDRRIQVVFTTDPTGRAVFQRGVAEMLADMEAAVIDWEHATATEFDLIIAASENDRLHLLSGPILLISHGFGHQKYYPNGRVVAGMNPERLLRDGRVVPTMIGISHHGQRADLARTCPPAVDRATVIGDPALDRMLASRHHTPAYRSAFDAAGRTVVLLTSTWGPDSLFGRRSDLPETVAAALPVDDFRPLLLLHPGVWSAHSPWQIRAWLARAQEAGLRVVEPQHWQAALLAAHAVISDHSSLGLYAAALAKPLLLTDGEAAHTVVDSPLAELAASTDRFDPRTDPALQVERLLATTPPPNRQAIIERGVGNIGSSARRLRGVMYDLLCLPDPHPGTDYPPAPKPGLRRFGWTTLVSTAVEQDGTTHIRRVPALRHGFPVTGNDFRHLVADLDTATMTEVASASIIVCAADHDFAETARRLLDEWPNARLIAARTPSGDCLVHHADGSVTARIGALPAGFDPTVLASMVYLRLMQGRSLLGTGHLALGDRVVTVRVAAG
ncbi:hypothetical protein [Nocardia nova]|uniref:hypothetical protein n=1 Tax=Nocardia nova TaxID=37330 RepID=UPI00046CF3E9|nr:hypothetical protein [Nocardia nova]